MTGAAPLRRSIRRLSEATIERIAAGEVVDRPASVVKELIENAFDAHATEVRVVVGEGGIGRIRVDDDGEGIPRDELRIALERHATSKLADPDDLDRIVTLGFRGEALAAIAAVSHLTLTSRVPGSDEAWTVRAEGGTVAGPEVAGRPVGTTVEVRDLFFNTPARRKFLRSPAVEQLAVLATVERLHLARPDVALVVETGAGRVERYPRDRSTVDALGRLLGPEFLDQSFPVGATLAPGVRLEAVLGRPSTARGTSTSLHLTVNGRAVASRPIAQAVRAAYAGYIPRTRFPAGSLTLTVDPGLVDANVHPTKREVRLAGEPRLVEAIRVAVRGALVAIPHAGEPGTDGTLRLPEPAPPTPGARPSAPTRPGPPARQRSLLPAPDAVALPGSSRHPALRLLGCVDRIYWAAESPNGLVLVDQHAVSERLVYDALRRDGRLGRQELLDPIRLDLSGRERSALDAHDEEVARAGFGIESFGPGSVRVVAVPTYLGHRMSPEALHPLLEELAEGGRPLPGEAAPDRIAATIACHAAVRAGDVIAIEEMGRLVAELHRLADGAYACPHGRPILVEVPRSRLDRWFLRAGP